MRRSPGRGLRVSEVFPPHRASCDLPEDVLPGLKGRVEAGGSGFAGAEEVRGQVVCQVMCDLGQPPAGHGSTQLDTFCSILGKCGS